MKKESVLAIEIFGKNYSVSDGLKSMTEKKSSKLDNYFKGDENAKVVYTIALEGDTYTTDLVITTHGLVYRASAASSSPFDNLDIVIPKLLGQVRKQKSIWGKKGLGAIKKKSSIATDTVIVDDETEE